MTTYFEPINLSATHIYHSALELSPLSSVVRRLYYHRRRVPFPRVVTGTLVSWDQSINISGGGESPYGFLTWSPCGQIVAASYRGTVEIRDPFSSELISTLRPTKPISQLTDTLAYSPDGRSLATLSKTSIMIWDIQTGGVAKEVTCGEVGDTPLTWSSDGQAIGTVLLNRASNFNYTVRLYDVASGTTQSPGTLESVGIPHLWAHDESFRVMTTGWGGQARTINIFEVGSVLTEIESFRIMALGQYARIESFSPAAYRISAAVHDQIRVIDVRNSECLLQQGVDYASSHCFSSDGSLFSTSAPTKIYIWKCDSGRYTPWRNFPTQDLYTNLLRLSPTLSAIVGSFQGGLQVWRLDRPPVDARPDGDAPLTVLSHRGVYTATCHQWDNTITITNLLSPSPPRIIDTDMRIDTMALTGNVLLVLGRDLVTAWRLTEEGAVGGVSGDRNAGPGDSIWSIPLPGFPTFSIQGQTVVMKWGGNVIHVYHAETGEVLEPAQAPLRLCGRQYSLWDMLYGRHYPHYRGLEAYDTRSESDWPVSQASLQQGWVKDPEGRHRLWIPAEWRVSFRNAGWLSNVTTLWSSLRGGTVIVML